MTNTPKLTELEIIIMGVMWEQERDMTIHEISVFLDEEKFSPSSVSQAMKRLLKKNAVTISDHKPVANVYARTFRPTFERAEFTKAEIERLGGKLSFQKQLSAAGIIAELLGSSHRGISPKEMEELRQAIHKKEEN